ncbi:MAG: IMP dehydrogenase [Candidatus Tectimicrobiota bacterium]
MECEAFFCGKTYDDFLVRPQEGVVCSRREIRLTTRLTAHVTLALPIVSANMDSVTEAGMAKIMALEGGLGFIHRGLSIEGQAREVAQVKRSHGFVIEQPLCLPKGTTMREARAFLRQHAITGLLIEESVGSRILAGVLSNRDFPWLEEADAQPVEAFMTPVERLHTRAPGISGEEAARVLFAHRLEKLPLIDAERRIHGLITKKDLILSRQRPHASTDAKGRLLVGAAIGVRGDYLERTAELVRAGVDVILMDIAHGHSRVMQQAVESFRKQYAATPLICGNVGTAEGARFLQALGADGIKVGIGPGRGCRTRLETAAGVPQLQAIREAWRAVGEAVPLIADGGISHDKDLFLALSCGASTVMLGSLLAGTAEAPGTVITDPATGHKTKIYRGMTSPQAVLAALYDVDDPPELVEGLPTPPEGQQMQVAYKGSVVEVLHRLRGHLCSAVSYAGGHTLAEVRERIGQDPQRYLIPLSTSARRESYER